MSSFEYWTNLQGMLIVVEKVDIIEIARNKATIFVITPKSLVYLKKKTA